jgi:hypothetical protein
VKDLVRSIFEVLDKNFLHNLWDRGDDVRNDLVEIISLTYLIKRHP